MTAVEQLEYIQRTCPTLAVAGADIGKDAVTTEQNVFAAEPVLPPLIIIDIIRLVSNLLYFMLNGCRELPPNPTPGQMQAFMTERPTFGFRGMMIRKAARRQWREQGGIRGERIGIATDRKARSMTGTVGLRNIQAAMLETKKMNRMFATGTFSLPPEDERPTDDQLSIPVVKSPPSTVDTKVI